MIELRQQLDSASGEFSVAILNHTLGKRRDSVAARGRLPSIDSNNRIPNIGVTKKQKRMHDKEVAQITNAYQQSPSPAKSVVAPKV